MNVSLTTEMEQWVQQKVGTGLYTSASEVVREALRALHQKEMRSSAKLANLREALRVGMESADQGDLVEWNEDLSKEIKHLGRGRRRGRVA